MSPGCGSDLMDGQQLGSSPAGTCGQPNGCSNGCQQSGSFGSWVRRQGAIDGNTSVQQQQKQQQPASELGLGACRKCKQRPAVVHIRQQEPYCNKCLEAGVQQKVRVATKSQGLVKAGDHVMVALSGGAASSALLHCMTELINPNVDRPQRGKVPYLLSVVHIDTSAARGIPSQQAAQQLQQLASTAAAAGFSGSLVVLPLHAVFADQSQLEQQLQPGSVELLKQQLAAMQVRNSDHNPQPSKQQLQHAVADTLSSTASNGLTHGSRNNHCNTLQQQQLLDLLGNITDNTGREDLITYLQDHLLLRAAAALTCNRLMRGDCASRVAVRIIAEAAKGRGYSLPADIQLVDARELQRGGPCVVQPLREVTYKELVALCAYRQLRWWDRAPGQPMVQQQGPGSGSSGRSRGAGGQRGTVTAASVNALAEKFIDDMQQGVPASVYTVLRTVAHLEQFSFTGLSAVPDTTSLPPKTEGRKPNQQQQCSNKSSAAHSTHSTMAAVAQPGTQAVAAGACSSAEGQQQFCAVCRAPLPVQAAIAISSNSRHTAADRLKLAGLTGRHSHQLCYSCNRQILFQVQGAEPAAAALLPPLAGGQDRPCRDALQARLQRLKQLLPPGLLLDDCYIDD
eukprot:GHRR01010847.1.p1 GENE.GHRR01010847.1~~GHRR01010847.1.p1  ORF type:complete len:624 (+),score=226.22 GHRR01010847.1:660-2531(+)